jgi:WD40 repeat protein
MMIRTRISLALAIGTCAMSATAQAVLEPPVMTMACGTTEITGLVVAPKGDRILVLHSKGAELRDMASGKRVADFPYNEDATSTVYYGAFNGNGEYVVLIGFGGTREVWDVKTGKQDKEIRKYTDWMPDAIRTRALGLKKGNTPFDRYYQQMEAEHGGLVAHAEKDGAVVFTDAEGNAVQTLAYPKNKDQHHRAPCLFHEGRFITGTDDGRVLFYDLVKR